MGGIAGLLGFGRQGADPERVERMMAALRRRGPGADGMRRSGDGRLALGVCQRRPVLQPPVALPYASETGEVWVALDGAIDNYRPLRHGLELAGHRFSGILPGEVVVHAYEAFGFDFLRHLQGSFALALWDVRASMLILARDRLGERPLYWTRTPGGLAFASHLGALLEGAVERPRLDLKSLAQYLGLGFVMAPATLVEGIAKLAPGAALVVDRHGQAAARQWWLPGRERLSVEVPPSHDVKAHAQTLRVLVDTAIADRLNARPMAALWNGKPESVAMAVSMSRLLGREIDLLMFGNGVLPAMAGPPVPGLRLVPFQAPGASLAAHFDDYLEAMDEPLGDPAAVEAWWTTRLMREQGFDQALAAEGADTVMLGGDLTRAYGPAPWSWRWALKTGTLGRRAALALYRFVWRRKPDLGSAPMSRAFGADPALDWGGVPVAAGLLGPALADAFDRHRPALAALTAGWGPPLALRGDELAGLGALRMRSWLPEAWLSMMDRMAAANSVELRFPFLDPVLVDYAHALPSPVRLAGGRPKGLLHDALANLMPARPMPTRQFHPGPGALRGLEGEIEVRLRHRVQQSPLFRQGLFDAEACLALLEAFRVPPGHLGALDGERQSLAWSLLALAEWIERHGVALSAETERALGEAVAG